MNDQNIEFHDYAPRGRIQKGVVDSRFHPFTVMKGDGKLLHRIGGNQRLSYL